MALSNNAEDKVSPMLSVSNYRFVDNNDDPVSFSVLPIRWSDKDRRMIGVDKPFDVFLIGETGNDNRRIHKHVVAWRFEIIHTGFEIFVLSTGKNWIRLREPKKRFRDVARPIFVTLHCLHFAMRNLDASEESIGLHVTKALGLDEARDFERELVNHLSLIGEAVGRNVNLAKSEFLQAFLKRSREKRESSYEDVVPDDDHDDDDQEEYDKLSDSSDQNEDVCALCDEGGKLLICDGRCLRSFHGTKAAAAEANHYCKSLGFTKSEVDAMPNFVCDNCKYEQHQCFACGKLGFSGKSRFTEVFRCCSAGCGYFYHPKCVSELLNLDSKVSAEEVEEHIAEGRSFTCPIHRCKSCKQDEDEDDPELQFAVCRRCPKSYHIKCLPSTISFETDKARGVVKRAWRDIIPNRVLLYCVKHKMDEKTGTAHMNHIKFPSAHQKQRCSEKKKKRKLKNQDERRKKIKSESLLETVTKNRKLETDEKPGTSDKNHIAFPSVDEKLSSSGKRKVSSKEKKRKSKKRVKDSKEIKPESPLETVTEIRLSNSVAESSQQSPSNEYDQRPSNMGPESPNCDGSNASYLKSKEQFARGPWDGYLHHPNGGWIVDD